MAKLFVVLGATGLQGGSVIRTYLEKPQWRIRAVTRDPSKPAAKKLEEQGIEVVAADFDDVDSLIAAFKLLPNQTKNQFCYALEVQHGDNIALAARQTLDTLELLIWSSLVDTAKWSQGKYTWNYHFDSKAHVYDHIVKYWPELARKTSLLFMGSYMSNFFNPALGPQRVHGGEAFVLAMPHGPDVPEPYVDPRSDTGKFVEALEALSSGGRAGGKKLFGVSDMRTCGEFLRIWGETVGVKARFEEVSREEYIARVGVMDQALAREVADSRGFNSDFGWIGGEEGVLMPGDLGIKTTTIEEYIRRADWSQILER